MHQSQVSKDVIERRVTNRLLAYWETLRGDDPLPIEDAINPGVLQDVWDDCFLIHTYDIGKGSEYNYTFLGANILRSFDKDITQNEMLPLASPSADRLAEQYRRVIETRAPVIEQGCFVNAQGQEIRYRQCLLPFGTGDTVTSIFGGMRYRIV